MEFTCLKDQLYKSLQLAEKYSAHNSTIPTLQGILIEASKNTITIRATDLNTGFETKISAQVKKEGSVVIPAKPSVQLVSSFKGDKVQVEVKQNTAYFISKNSNTALKCYSSEDFPKLPKIKGESSNLDIKEFLEALKSVYFAASQSEIKPEIASIYFKKENNKQNTVVATDSFRLAEKTFGKENKNKYSFLFPAKNISEFIRVLENFEGEASFIFDTNHIFITHPSFSFFARLISGSFPDYNQIIPLTFNTEVTIKKSDLIEGLKLAGIFSGKLNEIKLKAYAGDNILEISTSDSDIGEHVGQLNTQITGENIEASFNQKYLADGLVPIDSDMVILRFSGASRPLLVQSPQDSSYVYLVMPMKNS